MSAPEPQTTISVEWMSLMYTRNTSTEKGSNSSPSGARKVDLKKKTKGLLSHYNLSVIYRPPPPPITVKLQDVEGFCDPRRCRNYIIFCYYAGEGVGSGADQGFSPRWGDFQKKIQNFLGRPIRFFGALPNHYKDPILTKFSAPQASFLKKK